MTAVAVDHLADLSGLHIELLRALTDDQLAEQMEWYRQQRAAATKAVDSYGYSKLLSTASVVQRERHENDTP